MTRLPDNVWVPVATSPGNQTNRALRPAEREAVMGLPLTASRVYVLGVDLAYIIAKAT
jgi:hypothetical protein